MSSLVGQKFNFLTVLEEVGNNKLICECVCGKIRSFGKHVVIRPEQATKSCGCYRRKCGVDKVADNKLTKYKMIPTGSDLIIYDFWRVLLLTAARRSITVSILPIDLEHKFTEQDGKCVFTGIQLTLPKSAVERRKSKCTASVDRIDSTKGYTIDNIQWVHKSINLMKSNWSDKEFIEWCRLVYQHRA